MAKVALETEISQFFSQGIWEDYRGYKFITDHHSLGLVTHLPVQMKK